MDIVLFVKFGLFESTVDDDFSLYLMYNTSIESVLP